ncbi:alanine racemase [Neisseria weaveri]|uniref:alanine racemase n=1 Tax=Neisseria weaveri TaxID=28091 RepID=UPI00022313DA|nr:alanine racemase [Neisseria weaveri]EGV35852.1 alanine racemase [Neisseria weaveri ATCC 51223]SAY51263.1 alanine racemase [Neisseria weaveri]
MRPLNAQIRLDYLRENYQTLKAIHGNKLLAVVKADAYGHGAVRCAHALADLADGFAVATIHEAVELRENGITQPILLLEGVFEAAEYALVDRHRLWPAVCSQWQLEALAAHNWQNPVKVWLKMDSGMHRAGFFPHNYAAAYTALKQQKAVDSIVKFTHFACADETDNGMTEMQIEAFDLGCEGLAGEESMANSAAILAHPAARRDWGRAGIALYGVDPFGKTDPRLKPVMRLSTRVFGERVLQPHSPVGYGAAFYTSKSTRVGLLACGYADGYPRRAETGTPVAINGHRSRVIGRISMDMMTVELDPSHEGLGNEVELWGDTVNINEVAAAAGTIAYEILCNVKRAKFTYYE